MKTTILAIALGATATAHAFPNQPTGFRGIEWGTPFEAVAEQFTVASGQRDDVKFYTRKDDKLAIGAAELKYINYVFYKGQFQGAMIRTADGVAHQYALREAFRAQFGDGHKPNRYMDKFHWFGGATNVTLDCYQPATNHCIAYIRSKAITDLEIADKKAAAHAAKKDF